MRELQNAGHRCISIATELSQYARESLNDTQTLFLTQSYAQLRESLYGGLVMQTRLKPYLDSINLTIDDERISPWDATGIKLDCSGVKVANDWKWSKTE